MIARVRISDGRMMKKLKGSSTKIEKEGGTIMHYLPITPKTPNSYQLFSEATVDKPKQKTLYQA